MVNYIYIYPLYSTPAIYRERSSARAGAIPKMLSKIYPTLSPSSPEYPKSKNPSKYIWNINTNRYVQRSSYIGKKLAKIEEKQTKQALKKLYDSVFPY
jgi:hypothetical protein